MTQPPKTTPHSDLSGVHRDEKPNIETALKAGQDSGDLKRASDETVARPPYSDDQDDPEDRSR